MPVGSEPVIWLPEHFPGTLILDAAPPGFPDSTLDLRALGHILADGPDLERHWVIGDISGRLYLWLRHPEAMRRPAIVLAVDDAFALRLDVASRLARRLHGGRVSLLPPALQLTPFQRLRLVQLLQAFDIHAEGGGVRDVAMEVLASAQAALPSVEWKDSAARRKAIRLIHDSMALVNRGYLKLLRGK